jgi:hypothetical protein
MFNQLKNAWGLQETWQQTRQVLHRWVQLLTVADNAAHCGGYDTFGVAPEFMAS